MDETEGGAMGKKVVYYTSKNGGCEPCNEINELIEQGRFRSPTGDVDLVDITTDEGFERFNKEILSKQDGAVPSAYLDGKKCMILINQEEDVVEIECPSNDQPSGQEQTPSPEETGA